MAVKNLYQVISFIHNDNNKDKPITEHFAQVVAKSPAHAHNKVVRTLGDKLLFIQQIFLTASNDEKLNVDGNVVQQYIP